LADRDVTDDVVNVILELGAAHFELFDFLVGREIDIFFDAIDFVIEPMILIEDAPEMVVGAFEAPN
jgi:hypothetical protein